MILLKKILTCLSLLFVMALTTSAQARPAELTEAHAYELDRYTVRIEISYRGGKLDVSDISQEYFLQGMKINLDNTSPGGVSEIKVQSGAKDFIKKSLVSEIKKRQTSIYIRFNSVIKNDSATINFEEADRSEKKDARIIIDVKKILTEEDIYSPSDPSGMNEPYDTTEYFNGDGKIIVLDPGHGGSDSGAVGPTGVREKTVALGVSLKAQKLLAEAGYHVVMTRTTDIDVAAPGVPDGVELQARVDKSPPNAELFISVHCNAFSNRSSHGMETFHAPTATKGARLARLLNEELEKFGGLFNRGVKSARFYVMTHSKCPASLIELGFITNPREEQLLASEDYQQKLAQAITSAVNRYFNEGGYD